MCRAGAICMRRGHWCEEGTVVPAACPIGVSCSLSIMHVGGVNSCVVLHLQTFAPAFGNTHIDGCVLCTAGFFCDLPGLVAPSGQCSAGFYVSQSPCMTSLIENPLIYLPRSL